MSQLTLPSETGFHAAAVALLEPPAQAIVQQVPGARTGDADAVHDLRVASRRLRAALLLFAPVFAPKPHRQLSRAARSLTRALGTVRERDVLLAALDAAKATLPADETEGLTRLIRRTKQQQRRERQALRRYLRKARWDREARALHKALAAPSETDPPFLAQAGVLREKLFRLRAYDPLVRDPGQVEALHAMRIEAKRLRYLLELFAPVLPDTTHTLLKTITGIQEQLGTLHDLDVLLVVLEKARRRERKRAKAQRGLRRLETRLATERAERFHAFLMHWDSLPSEQLSVDLDALLAPASDG